MKIVGLLGSPATASNSSAIARTFFEQAEIEGASVSSYRLSRMKFSGCQACMVCKTRLDHCVLEDDLTPVLKEIHSADILVLASPVYFGDVSSQMKQFIDRTYSYYVPDFNMNPKPGRLPEKKRMVFVQTQAMPDEHLFNDIYPKYDFFFQVLGFTGNRLIRALGVDTPGSVEKRPELHDLARKTAVELIG